MFQNKTKQKNFPHFFYLFLSVICQNITSDLLIVDNAIQFYIEYTQNRFYAISFLTFIIKFGSSISNENKSYVFGESLHVRWQYSQMGVFCPALERTTAARAVKFCRIFGGKLPISS